MIVKEYSPELGNHNPNSSATGNERVLPLSPRCCRETGSNPQPLGHEPSTVPQNHQVMRCSCDVYCIKLHSNIDQKKLYVREIKDLRIYICLWYNLHLLSERTLEKTR